jgi:nicotinate-nucleotide adenylyltransferase
MTYGSRIGILGGTFDPVHMGHVETAVAAQRALALDTVLLMPSGTPPHRQQQPHASRFHRFAMAALAVNGIAHLAVSDLEIGEAGPSYTFDTLTRLHASGLKGSQIFFITGADAFAEIESWSRYPDVLDMAHFVVVSRPGHPAPLVADAVPSLAHRLRPGAHDGSSAVASARQLDIYVVDAPTPDVSSTDVRRRLTTGESIEGLVPQAVRIYIAQHGLYSRAHGSPQPGRSLA